MKRKVTSACCSLYGSSLKDKAFTPYSVTFNTQDMFAIIEDIGIDAFVHQSQQSIEQSIRNMWNDYNS